jgi:NTE family protein
VSERLDALDFLAPVPTDDRSRIAQEVEWLSVPGGAVLFEEGAPANRVYFVLTGRLRVVSGSDRVVVSEIGPGEPGGELGLLTAVPRSATIRAVRDPLLIRLSAPTFERIVATAPTAVLPLTRVVAQRMLNAQQGRRDRSPVTRLPCCRSYHPGNERNCSTVWPGSWA